jgi:hypothetical protein
VKSGFYKRNNLKPMKLPKDPESIEISEV